MDFCVTNKFLLFLAHPKTNKNKNVYGVTLVENTHLISHSIVLYCETIEAKFYFLTWKLYYNEFHLIIDFQLYVEEFSVLGIF